MFVFLFYTIGFTSLQYRCVELPNGFLVGYAAVFPKKKRGVRDQLGKRPDMAIKHPDGRVLLRGDSEIEYWDDQMIIGAAEIDADHKWNRFIFVNDIGLIIKSEQQELYERYYVEKFEKNPEKMKFTPTNLFGIFLNLWNLWEPTGYEIYEGDSNLLENKYRRPWCSTAIFEPEMVDLDSITAK